jgi:hypothetical protein
MYVFLNRREREARRKANHERGERRISWWKKESREGQSEIEEGKATYARALLSLSLSLTHTHTRARARSHTLSRLARSL